MSGHDKGRIQQQRVDEGPLKHVVHEQKPEVVEPDPGTAEQAHVRLEIHEGHADARHGQIGEDQEKDDAGYA